MAYRLAPGHRLRLALSNTYWPFLWPSPAAGKLTLLEGKLDLPVHQGVDADEWQPPAPKSAAPWKHRVLQPATSARRIEQDLIRGTVALVVEDDQGRVENLTHGLITADRLQERWEIKPDDPLSAYAKCVWEQDLARGDWQVRTHAVAEMRSDAAGLHISGRSDRL